MDTRFLMWALFLVVVTTALFIDLAILNKHKGNIKTKNAATMVCIWISLSLIFGTSIYFAFGREKALEYFAGYIVEYSLSIDNMFVFLMIFSYFAISKANQSKVLIYGIAGAVILRFLFILIGIRLINTFHWIMYVFGVLLVYTAIKMLYGNNKKISPKYNTAYNIIKKLIPFKNNTETNNFFIKENKKIYATPMLAAIIVAEMSDLIFAVDSIPAVLSISKDTFIVYSSNIFAIIGLRSLYFILSNFVSKFKYLHIGIAVILIFVGLKMILSRYVPISTGLSLAFITLVIGISVLVSIRKKANV
ncbi:MAG: TerC/Alx family metal homeostasis membrane protein [Endomicrobium sp.]|jgi:tellurite resistance protein TerC|nr:TerC/Alx family metal homeostasis membrane protein [Endomicrobium sp.]